MKLNFGITKIYYGVMYNQFLKRDLPQATGTLFIAEADTKNKQKRKWHICGISNVYCKACSCLMVIPNAGRMVRTHKSFTCPSCGRTHSIDNILVAENENSLLPCYMSISLLEKKETIDLCIKYNGVIMGNDVYNDFKEVDNVVETFSFDTNKHTAVWRKQVNDELEEVIDIGYYSDLKIFNEKSALCWLNSNYKSIEEKGFCEMLKVLRNAINGRMKNQGLSKRKMYFNGSNQYKAIDNVLGIAHQVRFWDCKTGNAYGNGRYKLDEWQRQYKVDTDIEKKVETLMKEGTGYVEALVKASQLPNTKFVRKNISLETLHNLKKAYSISGVETYLYKLFTDWFNDSLEEKQPSYCYEAPYHKAYEKMEQTCNFLKAFIDHYRQVPIQKMVDFAISKDGRDTLYLWSIADKLSKKIFNENVPKFKELHDYLSVLVAKQADREIEFDIPEYIVNRMDMYLKNTNYKVLEKFSQVKQASLDLKNCASGYRNRINENLQLVLMSDDKGKPIALLEIKRSKIVQAKLFANVAVFNDRTINDEVIEFAKKAKLGIDTKDIKLAYVEEEELKSA